MEFILQMSISHCILTLTILDQVFASNISIIIFIIITIIMKSIIISSCS